MTAYSLTQLPSSGLTPGPAPRSALPASTSPSAPHTSGASDRDSTPGRAPRPPAVDAVPAPPPVPPQPRPAPPPGARPRRCPATSDGQRPGTRLRGSARRASRSRGPSWSGSSLGCSSAPNPGQMSGAGRILSACLTPFLHLA